MEVRVGAKFTCGLSSPTLARAAATGTQNEADHVRLHAAAACARHLCNLAVEVGVPVDAGHSPLGQRRLVPILGGTSAVA